MNETSGMSGLTILGIIFVILKLVGSITWSWWWVLAPFWIIPILWGSVVVIGFIIAMLTIR